jgi:hypothetical protein
MLSWVKWALRSEPQLFVDAKRINPEIQAERRRELQGSLARRRKIMDRMVQGYACQHPSWIQDAGARVPEDDEPRRATA